MTALLVVAVLGLVLLAGIHRRARVEIGRLRRGLEASSRELQHLQTSFARFAPEELVNQIAAGGKPLHASEKLVTVLFADLVGFTRMGETLDPEHLVKILNSYFQRMSRVIGEHRGHVSKFIGDGMMALFGALEPNPWQANDAVHAALGMREELARYNRELAGQGLPELRFGVGIHRGPAVAGVIGTQELLEFTVIGHTVNLASRIERLTRVHDVDILVTSDVRQTLDPRFVLRELPATAVRGVSEPAVTYAVEGFEGS